VRQIILILSISILSFGSIAAQQKHLHTKNLDAFTGIWEYKTENELFRIVFVKGKYSNSNAKIKYDCVIGGYLYIKDRDTIGDYTKNIPVQSSEHNLKEITIRGTNAGPDSTVIDPNHIRLVFNDRKIGKITWGFGIFQNKFTLLSPTEARFQVFNDEGDGLDYPLEFSVPVDVIMKKVK
jgi:NDP-sugar pyrophosphorylase family protein